MRQDRPGVENQGSGANRFARFRADAVLILLVLTSANSLFAADEPKVKVETLSEELSDPCGLAIHPGMEELFVSDTGAARIVRISRAKPDRIVPVIAGFEQTPVVAQHTPIGRIGPLGLAFLNEHTLAVGSSSKDGDRTIRVYVLPAGDEAGESKPIEHGAAKQVLGGAREGEDAVSAEGKFYGLAVSPFSPPALFATNPGSSRGWIFKSDIKSWASLEDLKPFTFIPQKTISQVGLPSGAITVNRRGLVVLGMANTDRAKDGSLAFFSGKNGAMMASYPVSLREIVGLAYSPETGRLYAADFGAGQSKQGGIFRLDSTVIDARSGVKAIKVVAVERPTAIAFASDNTMYVTTFGAGEHDEKGSQTAKGGRLLKITGEL